MKRVSSISLFAFVCACNGTVGGGADTVRSESPGALADKDSPSNAGGATGSDCGPGEPPPPAGYVVNLADFGAQCNGSHDDKPALESALADVREKGGGTIMVPSGDCRIVQKENSILTQLVGPVTIRGVSGASRLALDSDQQGAYRVLFAVMGNDVALETIQLVRASNVYGIMLDLYGLSNLSMKNVVMDGKKDSLGGKDIHGIRISGTSGEQIKNVTMLGSTIKNMDFGLFQDSSTTSTTDGFSVDGSTFSGNYDDDLEFNAPSSTMVNITVKNSTFTNNRASSDAHPSGFGVGLANVQHAIIQNNTFDGYRYDPIHIEDRSADVSVDHNRVQNSFTASLDYASHVFIVSGAHDIRITNNTFDTAANNNSVACIFAGAGGSPIPPYDITITGNDFRLRPNARVLDSFDVRNIKMENNTIVNIP